MAEDVDIKGYESFEAPFSVLATIRAGKLSYAKLRQVYEETSSVRSAVDAVVKEITTLPWDITPTQPDYAIPHLNCARDFFLDPNENHETFSQILSKVLTDLLVYDNAYVEKVRNAKGDVVELFARDAQYFSIKCNKHGLVEYYKQSVPNYEEVEFDPQDIICFVQYPSTNSRYGTPIIESLIDEIATYLFSNAHIAESFTRDEIPPGILNLGQIGKDAYEQAKAEFKAKRAKKQELRVVRGTPKVEWVDLKRPNKEMQLDELRRSIERVIFRAFGVTPVEMGVRGDIGKTASYVQRMIAERKRVVPIINLITYYLNREILQQEFGYNDVEFKFDFSPTRDVEGEARAHERYVRTGIMTRNEARGKLGMGPIPGGERLFVVSGGQLIFLDEASPKPQEEVPETPETEEDEEQVEGNDELTELAKLHLGQFRSEGIDQDMKDMPDTYENLIADHTYLHAGFYELKKEEEWGDWTEKDVVKYHAAVVSTLREFWFPMRPITEDKKWAVELDRRSKRYETKDPPKTKEEEKEWDRKREEIIG